ncbi:hypothetical protein BN1423_290018 [Carnobacterium maltaromaticum]|nr:conserved hypothetical protein [Carnobacterium maltaromaticum]CAD5898860.1 conserved hypothetical protein [Carnobacterium maltaromaticum]CRH17609.1 hypothetical protein CM318V1_1570057 [Carnobacterium maltaromaticum]CRH22295.1 hypothetical protein BN1423_290018 [Carnobacterium maltaromaticum]
MISEKIIGEEALVNSLDASGFFITYRAIEVDFMLYYSRMENCL